MSPERSTADRKNATAYRGGRISNSSSWLSNDLSRKACDFSSSEESLKFISTIDVEIRPYSEMYSLVNRQDIDLDLISFRHSKVVVNK